MLSPRTAQLGLLFTMLVNPFTPAWAIKAGGINEGLAQDESRGGLFKCEWELESKRATKQILEYQAVLNAELRQKLGRSNTADIPLHFLESVLPQVNQRLSTAPLGQTEKLMWEARLTPVSFTTIAPERRAAVFREYLSTLTHLNAELNAKGFDKLKFWTEYLVTTARRESIDLVPDHLQIPIDLKNLDAIADLVHENLEFFKREYQSARHQYVWAIAGSIGTSEPKRLLAQARRVVEVDVPVRLPVRVRYILFRLKTTSDLAETADLLNELNNYLNLARVQFALEHPELHISVDIFEC